MAVDVLSDSARPSAPTNRFSGEVDGMVSQPAVRVLVSQSRPNSRRAAQQRPGPGPQEVPVQPELVVLPQVAGSQAPPIIQIAQDGLPWPIPTGSAQPHRSVLWCATQPRVP